MIQAYKNLITHGVFSVPKRIALNHPARLPDAWSWPPGDTHFAEHGVWYEYQRRSRDAFMRAVQIEADYKDAPPYMGPSPRHTLLDIGAHAGTWSLDLAGRFTRVIAWEPEHWLTLSRNAQWLKIHNVEVRPHAVSDRSAPVDFWSRADNTGDSGIGLGCEAETRIKRTITTRVIDQELEHYTGWVDAVKIDVQGHEYWVLAGMKNVVEKYQPVICAELNDGCPAAETLLKSWGYAVEERVGKDWIWMPK